MHFPFVDRLHVGASEAQVEEALRRALKPGVAEKKIKQLLKIALKQHRENREMYGYVMGGMHRSRRRNPELLIVRNPMSQRDLEAQAWGHFVGHQTPAQFMRASGTRDVLDAVEDHLAFSSDLSKAERDAAWKILPGYIRRKVRGVKNPGRRKARRRMRTYSIHPRTRAYLKMFKAIDAYHKSLKRKRGKVRRKSRRRR